MVKSLELFQFISASLGLATCTLKIGLEAICDNVFVLMNRNVKAAKYEIQKPSTCRATLFHCKFWSMFPVFHLA